MTDPDAQVEGLLRSVLTRDVVMHLIRGTAELTLAFEGIARNLPVPEEARRAGEAFREEFRKAYGGKAPEERPKRELERIELE